MVREGGEEEEESKRQTSNREEEGSSRNNENTESMMLVSPRFKSVAAMAGWDEESILIATLVVEDTPDRDFKSKRRSSSFPFKTPPSTHSRRKRRVPRKSLIASCVPPLNLDDEEESTRKAESEKEKTVSVTVVGAKDNAKGDVSLNGGNTSVPYSSSVLPCMDKLREELSCAICLEICFEPSTTSCGHSFCKKCLRSAADKCGKKCPKCRQLISNGRSCTVNTVLWNTIQLLFPQEVEARKASNNIQEPETKVPQRTITNSARTRNTRVVGVLSGNSTAARRSEILNQDDDSSLAQRLHRQYVAGLASRDGPVSSSSRRTRGTPGQDEDAALALRLQREEFMDALRETTQHSERPARSSLHTARANLRAMASRAISTRMRSQPM